ncbi:MAG: peptidoglycan DD-metalloendopeptidase family protein [Polaromonas sp.]|nr:peptidoglycan DD-metalloendopeptidase family protein [Polaromonas sp.]
MNQTTRSSKVDSLVAADLGHCASLARRLALPCALVAVMLLAAGCASRSYSSAPVEDRGTGLSRQLPGAVESGDIKQLPGFENAGKAGYYTVKPGDTMIRIGLENGQNWRDIVHWNKLENPNIIEVGQVLRVVPPTGENPLVVTRPVSSGVSVPAPVQAASSARPASAPVSAIPAPVPEPAPAPAANGDENVAWIWPAQGTLVAGFDEAKNKGLDIAGKAGDPVMASADGRVVYAGAGLRGYGNLVILKHNNTFLTAYAHNQTLFVREDQTVRKGQKIAEMGKSDAERVKLHFEIRRQGKPVDPAKYLPAK